MRKQFRRAIAWICMSAMLTGSASSYALAGEAVPEETAGSQQLLEEVAEQTLQVVAEAQEEFAQDGLLLEDTQVPVFAAAEDAIVPEEDLTADDWSEEAVGEGEEELLLVGEDLIEDDSAEPDGEDLPEAGEVPANSSAQAEESAAEQENPDAAVSDVTDGADAASDAESTAGDVSQSAPEAGTEDLPFEEPETEDVYALEEIELETEDDALLMLEEAAEDAAEAMEVSDTDFGYVYIDEDEDALAITGYYGSDESVNIPSYLHVEQDGDETEVKVTEIRKWNSPSADVTDIHVPYTVETIARSAFSGYTSLETIIFEENPTGAYDGLFEIAPYAFYGAKNLTSVTIPATVETIDDGAFARSGLKSLTFAEGSEANIGERAFEDTPLETITFPQNGQIRIGNEAFYKCKSLTDLTITGVSYLRNGAFSDCSLTSVDIDCDIATIGGRAFENNRGLTFASIKSVTEIQYGAFRGCVNLDQIEFPGKLKRVGIHALQTTKWLTNQPQGEIEVPGLEGCLYLYKGNTPENYEIPAKYTSVNAGAFEGKSTLKSLTIPETVKSIGFEAFLSCPSLTEVEIPETVTEIGNYAFGYTKTDYSGTAVYDIDDYCNYVTRSDEFVIKGYPGTAAEEYAIENGITFIDLEQEESDSPFEYELNNEGKAVITGYHGTDPKVVVPDKLDEHEVVAIGEGAFYYATGISSVQLPASVKTIEDEAFMLSYIRTLTITNPSLVIGENAFTSSQITKLNFPRNGSVKIGESAFAGCNGLKTLNLEGVSEIGKYAFDGCSKLQQVSVGSKMKQIAQEAFRFDENLYKVDLKSVTTIEYAAFSWCSRLTEVVFPKKMDKIDYDAFVGTYWLNQKKEGPVIQSGVLYVYNGNPTRLYTVPSGVTYITAQAFRNKTNLEAVELPGTVREIGQEAFIGNTKLRYVHIPSSVQKVGEYAFGYTFAGSKSEGTKFVFGGRTIHYVKKAGDLNICGMPGTAAHAYAKANGFTFSLLDDNNMLPSIILNVSGKLPMKVGQVFNGVTAKCTFPKDKIKKWSSSNSRVVSVNALTGKLTAKKVGLATITVTSEFGGKASFIVSVSKKKVRTKGISVPSVNKKKVTLKKKKKLTLKTLLNPITSQDKITFTSSNKKVVTVTKKGKIKALKKGKAKITIRSGKKKFAIKITVK